MAESKPLQFKIDPNDESGVYANAVSFHKTKNEVILDFGYFLPGADPATVKVVSRVNMTKETAAGFAKSLSKAMTQAESSKLEQ